MLVKVLLEPVLISPASCNIKYKDTQTVICVTKLALQPSFHKAFLIIKCFTFYLDLCVPESDVVDEKERPELKQGVADQNAVHFRKTGCQPSWLLHSKLLAESTGFHCNSVQPFCGSPVQ